MRLKEVSPSSCPLSFRCWVHSHFGQDISNGRSANFDLEAAKRIADLCITSPRIFRRKTKHKCPNRIGLSWSSGFSRLAAVVVACTDVRHRGGDHRDEELQGGRQHATCNMVSVQNPLLSPAVQGCKCPSDYATIARTQMWTQRVAAPQGLATACNSSAREQTGCLRSILSLPQGSGASTLSDPLGFVEIATARMNVLCVQASLVLPTRGASQAR